MLSVIGGIVVVILVIRGIVGFIEDNTRRKDRNK